MASGNAGRAMALLRVVSSGDADGTAGHVSPSGFVQHDPAVADGIAGLRERATQAAGEAASGLEVARVLEDGPFVVVHGRAVTGDAAEVFFAVLRFEDGLVAEQWRFAAPIAPPNESGHTQTDGPTEPGGKADTEGAKALVRDYYETVHIGGRHDQVRRFMSGDRQVRHEPGVRDGVAAFERDLAMLTRDRTIDAIVLLAGEGDLVFIAARGTHGGAACAYIDLYRVEGDQLVEHWGFPQTVPPREEARNGNGVL